MKNFSFLHKVARQVIEDTGFDFSGCLIVLPNKRARLFLLEAFKDVSDGRTFFAPEITSIEDFIGNIAKMDALTGVEQLFEFYEVYKQMTPKEVQQDFEQFSNWAKMLLQDFNEIDRYLLKPGHVFGYLKDIDDINHWSVKMEDHTRLIKDYLSFWEQLPAYYNAFNRHLKERNIGYQGLIYREAVSRLGEYLDENKALKVYFTGFNALNQSEEYIIQNMLKKDQAKVYWDTDEFFLNDPDHGAGYFARNIKQNWPYYKSYPYEWIVNEFQQHKSIEIISTPKSVGQAKIVGTIIDKLQKADANIQSTAVVLAEENLLIPVLYALPENVTSLNVTMSYDSKSNPVQLFFLKFFKMHIHALNRGKKAVFYHKEVLDVLSHPLVEYLADSKKMVDEINRRNLSFFQMEALDAKRDGNAFLTLVTEEWTGTTGDLLAKLEKVVIHMRAYLRERRDDISLTFLYAFYQVLNQIGNYQEKYDVIKTPQQLFAIYKQVADLAEVSFEGEPLQGLQVMGVLESRVLDFENVIVTSLNEGKLPAGKAMNSFIPYDVKLELGLPTFKEKDAIYTYHFYHLLKRARNIFLLYNSDSEGLDAGEKSRFVTQLLLDPQPNHQVKMHNYFAKSSKNANEPMVVEKSELLQIRLEEIATGKGFSPSAIGNYMRNPIQFYIQRVLGIREIDEVEENIALNTLGTIIHESLERLYEPFVGKQLSPEMVEEMMLISEKKVLEQFNSTYSDATDKQGKNLLAFEVAKRSVHHFLKMEKEQLEAGDEVEIIGLEQKLETIIEDESLPFPVVLSGIADRVEMRNGVLRIIDYKTGKVEINQVQVKEIEGLTKDLKFEKAIQLLIYGLMYHEKTERPIQAGIYSFKNRKTGYLMFGLKKEGNVQEFINEEVLKDFKAELVKLLAEILNPDISFDEKEI